MFGLAKTTSYSGREESALRKATALKRWITTERCWKRCYVSLASLHIVTIIISMIVIFNVVALLFFVVVPLFHCCCGSGHLNPK